MSGEVGLTVCGITCCDEHDGLPICLETIFLIPVVLETPERRNANVTKEFELLMYPQQVMWQSKYLRHPDCLLWSPTARKMA